MPTRLTISATRKITDDDYNGSTISIATDVDSELVTEPAKLRDRIRQLFGVVQASLAEDFNGGLTPTNPPAQPANGQIVRPRGVRAATRAQVKAIYAIAREQCVNLRELLRQRCGVDRPQDLTLLQASALIDDLKSSGEESPDAS
jgi:hypothetical protein